MTFTQEEQAEIEKLRNSKKDKFSMKKLNKIYNEKTGLKHNYCMCTSAERAIFYNIFFDWYDKNNG